jgi:hypothetical protein
MPSRKQRRRRQKDRRHEYEYVYVDESGTEVEVEGEEPADARANGAKAAEPRRTSAKPSKGGKQKQRPQATGGRVVQPPSWERVVKRTAIFIPIMFLAIYMLERDIGLAAQVLVTGQMLIIFIPFSYLMDRMMYRRYLRQTGQEPAKPGR